MQTIYLNEYDISMGMLIDVRHPLDYKQEHDPRSINIYADKLLANPARFLEKDKTYYIMCEKGHLSKKVVSVLTFYGYNAIRVII